MFPTVGRHLIAPPSSEAAIRQRRAERPDRSGCVVHHGAGTVTSANRGSPGHGPGDPCKAIHVAEFGAGRFISWGSEREGSAAWNHLARSEVEHFRSWRLARVLAGAQPERPIRVTTHHFGSSPPPRTTGSIKGRVVGRWKESRRHSCSSLLVCHSRVVIIPELSSFLPIVLSSFLSARSVRLGIDNSAFFTRPSSPATPPQLLRPHVADSTHPPGPVYHSAHSLLTLSSPPKSLPSRLTVVSHSLDRR